MIGEIVVADDKSVIREELTYRLTTYGFSVKPAATTAEALAFAASVSDIDVAVLDLMMDSSDGIEIAARILSKHPDAVIIFLTAFDSDDMRTKAARLGIVVYTWIDKSPRWLDDVSRAVISAVQEKRLAQVHRELRRLSKTDDGVQAVADHLDATLRQFMANVFVQPPADAAVPAANSQKAPWSPMASPTGAAATLHDVLSHLRVTLDTLRVNFDDVADRELVWQSFRQFANAHLWESVDNDYTDAPRQQLADQFDHAIRDLDSHNLTRHTLSAIQLTLERLASLKTSAADVHECELAWRRVEVSTLPSFAELLEQWDSLYGTDDEAEQ